LVVGEIGDLAISRTGAMLFFQLMTRRYEHASTVLISKKGLEEWATSLATALTSGAADAHDYGKQRDL
jgi:DNA replication protein DnaC